MHLSFGNLVVEFFGTGMLCFTVAATTVQDSSMAPVAIGLVLSVLSYSGSHLSGAMYNPAVALALVVRGGLPIVAFTPYVLAQLVGAYSGGALAKVVVGSIGCPIMTASFGPAFACEFAFAFALCHTVLHTATIASTSNSYYGIAIGFSVMSGAVAVGDVSGGAFNPALAVLTYLNGQLDQAHLLLYSASPLAAGSLAGFLFRITNPKESQSVLVGSREMIFYNPSWAPYVFELLGTFLLCFTLTQAAGNDLAHVAVGAILVSQVYVGGNASGANYNPAVTVALWIRFGLAGSRGMPTEKAISYVLTQCIGAGAAAALAIILGLPLGAPVSAANPMGSPALLSELIGTFFLVTSVLQSMTAEDILAGGKEHFGLAIGLSLLAMELTLGSVSGGAFNPSVGILGIINNPNTAVLFTAGPFAGGVLAAIVFRVTNASEFRGRELFQLG